MVICIFWDCIVYIEIIVFRALLARIQAIPYANSWASVYVAASSLTPLAEPADRDHAEHGCGGHRPRLIYTQCL